jgi:hypothetical protein
MIYTATCIMLWMRSYPSNAWKGVLCTRAHEGGFRAHTEGGGGAGT